MMMILYFAFLHNFVNVTNLKTTSTTICWRLKALEPLHF